jgi:hypothetical protein
MHLLRRVALLMVALLATLVPIGAAQNVPWPSVQDSSVTPVSGPSWLTHLGLTLDRTTLGQGAGRYGRIGLQHRGPKCSACAGRWS